MAFNKFEDELKRFKIYTSWLQSELNMDIKVAIRDGKYIIHGVRDIYKKTPVISDVWTYLHLQIAVLSHYKVDYKNDYYRVHWPYGGVTFKSRNPMEVCNHLIGLKEFYETEVELSNDDE